MMDTRMTENLCEHLPESLITKKAAVADDDPFESVLFVEELARQEGYLEGLKDGKKESSVRGFIVGFNTAASVSWDLGYARSFCATVLAQERSTLTAFGRKLCEEIIRKVDSYPHTNVDTEDLVTKVKDVQSAIEKVKSVVLKRPSHEETAGQKYSL